MPVQHPSLAGDMASAADPRKLQARAAGQRKLVARRRRSRRIRNRILGLSLAIFTGVWLAISVQLASGHDPALSSAARRIALARPAQAAAASASTPASASPSASSAAPSAPSTSSTSSGSSSSPAPVTTRQS